MLQTEDHFPKRPKLSETLPNRRAQHKNELCLKFQRGSCDYGDRCCFAHCIEEIRRFEKREDLIAVDENKNPRCSEKTKLCWRFMNGERCQFGDKCHFVHMKVERSSSGVISVLNVDENGEMLQRKQFPWRTKLCNRWMATGSCRYGVSCCFAHGESDVPSKEITRYSATKVCGGAPCGLSDARTSSREAKERSASMWKLWGGVILCFVFMGVEVFGGVKAHSLAILTDAAHLLSDVAAFAVSLFSVWASGWEATPRQSYGFFRIEILGTLVSIQIIWLITGILVYEAIDRIIHSTVEIEGSLMFGIATFGLVVNIFMMFILGHDGHDHGHSHDHGHGHSHGHGHQEHDHGRSEEDVEDVNIHGVSVTTHQHHHHGHGDDHDHDHGHEEHDQPLLKKYSKDETKDNKRSNINVQGAYLHVLGDSIQSIGVMIGAAVIWYNPNLKVIDPICTLLFSIIVLYTTINMLRDILEVLMESTPREIDATSLERGLCEIDEVVAIHELHIWAITVGKVLLACHVRIRPEADADMVLDKVVDYINREYNISHVTIQIERE